MNIGNKMLRGGENSWTWPRLRAIACLSIQTSLYLIQVAHQVGAYPSSRSVKCLWVLLISLERMLVHRRVTWIERHCESKVSCPRTQRSAPARARTRIAPAHWSSDPGFLDPESSTLMNGIQPRPPKPPPPEIVPRRGYHLTHLYPTPLVLQPGRV